MSMTGMDRRPGRRTGHILAISLMLGAIVVSHAATPVLAVHGGAGVVIRELTPRKERAVRDGLTRALAAGYAVLTSGGSSLEAVTRAVVVLEDDPHFNAGKGAVFDHEGHNALDAAIMDGATLRAGSVADLRRVRNPILLARAVMERSPHVMLVGDGAEQFAREVGIELVDPQYFYTEERWQQLQEALEAEKKNREPGRVPSHGTVGAVALDTAGRLAAATSTGGMTNKRYGRIGDSPIIGAGTYADAQCAVSATGWGEFYIRAVAAHDICARVEYGAQSLAHAAHMVVHERIAKLGGDGGVIAVDAQGHIAMPFNTEGMYRGWVDRNGKIHTAIFAAER
jgi:beta-aspartyl-peptidase (threonine type)